MKKMKKWIALAMMSMMLVLAGCGGNQAPTTEQETQEEPAAETSSDVLEIGIIQLVDHVALDRAREGFEAGLKEAGFEADKDIRVEFKNAQGDQSNLSTITQQFAADKKDLVCVIATPTAVAMASASKDIPIVGTAITDYEAANLVAANDAPGGNVTGTSDMNPVAEQLELMTEIMPEVKTVGVMYTSSEENSRIQIELFKEAASAKGIEVEEATVTNVNDIQQAATNLVGKVDAIYVPTDNTLASAISNLTGITNEAGIPVFPGETGMMEGGGLATLSVDYFELGKQTGAMAARILSGEAQPAEMAIEMPKSYEISINESVAEQLGIDIPQSVMDKVAEA